MKDDFIQSHFRNRSFATVCSRAMFLVLRNDYLRIPMADIHHNTSQDRLVNLSRMRRIHLSYVIVADILWIPVDRTRADKK